MHLIRKHREFIGNLLWWLVYGFCLIFSFIPTLIGSISGMTDLTRLGILVGALGVGMLSVVESFRYDPANLRGLLLGIIGLVFAAFGILAAGTL